MERRLSHDPAADASSFLAGGAMGGTSAPGNAFPLGAKINNVARVESDKRIYGLDVLRAAAIFLVVVSHILSIDPELGKVPAVGWFGTVGVELFFVLSGFLIGGIIIRLMHRDRFHRPRDLLHFWLNRWFRTLPVYYIFFFFYCFIHGNFFSQVRQRASFAFFVQNFAWPMPGDFFGQSWSLSVEEWFYVFFPLLLFSLYAWARLPIRASFLITAFYFLAGALALRVVAGPAPDFTAYDGVIRKLVVFRFDALMLGVLAAYLQYERPDVWKILAGRPAPAFVLLGAVCLFSGYGTGLLFRLPWIQLILFPLVSFAVALTMPFFAEWKKSATALRGPVVALAKSSYSVYLSHALPVTGMHKIAYLRTHHALACVLATVGIFVFGAFSYLCIEAPLMNLRQRWNARFDARQAPGAAAQRATS